VVGIRSSSCCWWCEGRGGGRIFLVGLMKEDDIIRTKMTDDRQMTDTGQQQAVVAQFVFNFIN
jgi:hypothetical protein